MAFTEDLSVFFDDEYGFALTATLGAVASGNVIFDRAYLQELNMVSGANPIALAKASDYDSGDVGGTLVITGKGTYTIRDVQPQDDGACVILQLELQ
jgi:hypothetical protein